MRATLLLLAGCRITPTGVAPDGPFFDGAPGLVGLALTCDQDAARWDLRVETDAWSGTGELYMTEDGAVVERHTVRAVESAGDGSWDCIDASLGQAARPEEAAQGSTSRWLCREEADLSFLFVVSDTDGEAWTDCVVWGANPALWADVAGVPACDTVRAADEDGVVYDGFAACG